MSGRGKGNTFTDQWLRWRPRGERPLWLTVYLWLYEAAWAMEWAARVLGYIPPSVLAARLLVCEHCGAPGRWSEDTMNRLFLSLDAADSLAHALEVIRRAGGLIEGLGPHAPPEHWPGVDDVGEVEALTAEALAEVERSMLDEPSDQTTGRIREAQAEIRRLAGRLMHQPSGREDDR